MISQPATITDFSVITPSYKQLSWLKLCAASVADQAGVNVEHIVQDAGSANGLEEWAARRPKLRLYVEEDRGMYDAINRGLRRASGEICAYLNCDEQYLPGTLRAVVDYFSEHPDMEVVFGDAVLINATGQPLSYRRAVLPGALHTRLVHLNTLSCATFFRRTMVERGLMFDAGYRAIGDAVWVCRLLREKVRMGVLPQPLSVFTFTGANLGAEESAHRENSRWNESPDTPPKSLIWPAIAAHRLKKLFAGAYLPRSCSIQIYTKDSPDARRTFVVKKIGYHWPKSVPGPAAIETGAEAVGVEKSVAAVFTTYNRLETAIRCVDCLLQQTVAPNKIYVVDNGSSDATASRIRERFASKKSVEVISMSENLGNPGGIAAAMQEALANGSNWVWILDDDSWPRKDALERLLDEVRSSNTVYSSLVLDPRRNDLSWPCVMTLPRPHVVHSVRDLPEVASFCLRGAWLGALVPKEVIRAVGLPDSALFIRGEDEEFPARIRRHGFPFVCARFSILEHRAPALMHFRVLTVSFFYEPHLALWKAFYLVRNRAFLLRKYRRFIGLGLAKAIAFVGMSVVCGLLFDDRKLSRAKLYLRAGWKGITNKLGKEASLHSIGVVER